MESLGVVSIDPFGDDATSLTECWEVVRPIAFLFKGAPSIGACTCIVIFGDA